MPKLDLVLYISIAVVIGIPLGVLIGLAVHLERRAKALKIARQVVGY